MTSDLDTHKQLVRRLVGDAINGENASVLDQVCTSRFAAELREWFAPFQAGFPDWRQKIDELVAEGETVVVRCRCGGTNSGEWLGVPATGRTMEVDEVWFFTILAGHLDRMWSLEDTWTRLLQLGTAAQAIQAAAATDRT